MRDKNRAMRDVGDAVPYDVLPEGMLVLRRDTWVPPYRVRREYGADRVVRPSFQFSVPSFRSNSA